MKSKILILVGVLVIGLPVVLLAQSQNTITSALPLVASGCMTISSGDTEVQTLTKQLTCVFNLTESLSVKLSGLEQKLSILESKLVLVSKVEKCTNGAIDYPTCVIIKGSTIDTEVIDTKVKKCTNGATDYPTCTIKVGVDVCKSTIAETKVIQTFLKAEGSFNYPTATGNYGNITKDAVKKFQTKEGITSTGLIDSDTLQKMKVLAPSVAPSISKSVEILCPTINIDWKPIIGVDKLPIDNGDVGIPVSN